MIKYLEPFREQQADEQTLRLVAQIRREFGAFVDPMAMHAPLPALLAAAWSALRESMLTGSVERRLKETVAAVVSKSNRCPFCVDAHTVMLHASGSASEALALRRGERNPFTDSKSRQFVEWAAVTSIPGDQRLANPPFSAQQAPELIATAFCMHYINRMANALLSDTPVPPSASPLKRLILWLSGYYFRKAVRTDHLPGASLEVLPGAPAPPDLSWAKPVPRIHRAMAALVQAVEEASMPYLEAQGKGRILQRIDQWQGEDMPLGNGWVEEALQELPEEATPSVRLALLAALASYRIDPQEVDTFRSRWPGDTALLAVLSWGSLQATRRLTQWL